MKFVQLTELENRHKEFLKLEECLIEVNSMFIELSELVAQQGDMVDSIEANVNNAKEYVSIVQGDTSGCSQTLDSGPLWLLLWP